MKTLTFRNLPHSTCLAFVESPSTLCGGHSDHNSAVKEQWVFTLGSTTVEEGEYSL